MKILTGCLRRWVFLDIIALILITTVEMATMTEFNSRLHQIAEKLKTNSLTSYQDEPTELHPNLEQFQDVN
jgi:hypothetical protein